LHFNKTETFRAEVCKTLQRIAVTPPVVTRAK
jgi:hypothetical protein